MITIWKLVNDSWEYVEECLDENALYHRIEQLRQDGNEYRAEKRQSGFAEILEV